MKPPAPGIHYNIPEAEYRAWDAVNVSSLIEIARSPAHYKWLIDNGRKDTPAFFQGRAFHTLMLYGREAYDRDFPKDIKPPPYTPKNWREVVEGQYKSIFACPEHRTVKALTLGKPEVCVVAVDPETGILCKGRLDRYIKLTNTITDPKTCQDARPIPFGWDVRKFHYHTKAAFYRHLVETITGKDTTFIWVAVEKAPPYGAWAHLQGKMPYLDHMDKQDQNGPDDVPRVLPMLRLLKKCRETNNWPCYPDKVSKIG